MGPGSATHRCALQRARDTRSGNGEPCHP